MHCGPPNQNFGWARPTVQHPYVQNIVDVSLVKIRVILFNTGTSMLLTMLRDARTRGQDKKT